MAAGFEQMLAEGLRPRMPTREDTLTLEELVPSAWWHRRFTCLVVISSKDVFVPEEEGGEGEEEGKEVSGIRRVRLKG